MEAVGHLYEHNADVFVHRKQQLAEILGLSRRLVAEDSARDFRQAVDKLCHFRPEIALDVFDGVVGIFDNVVEQSRAYRGRPQPYLAAGYARNRYGMENIGLA